MGDKLKVKLLELKTGSLMVGLVILVVALFIGLISPFYLSKDSYSTISQLVKNIFAALPQMDINSGLEAKGALSLNTLFLLIWYLAGLSLIGIPVSYLLLGIRGFILGFCLSILIMGDAAYGIVVSILAVLPQHLILIPIFLLATLFSVKLSGELIAGFSDIKTSLLNFSLKYAVLWLGIALAAWLQGYIAPKLLKLFFNLLS